MTVDVERTRLPAILLIGLMLAVPADGGPEGRTAGAAVALPAAELPDPRPPAAAPPGTPAGTPEGVYYDIVYSRAPRYGDDENTSWPEVLDPIRAEPGTDLVLLHPDGSEEVLVPGGKGAVIDPFVSFDGEWVYYAQFPDVSREGVNRQRRGAARAGADIYKIHLPTREIVRLTHQEWTPNTGVTNWSADPRQGSGGGHTHLGYGVFNLGPTPLPGGRIMFTSSRNGFLPNKDFTFPNMQLYVMDEDGSNQELVGHLSLGSALHPTILHDGRVMFSSYEAQGLRDKRLWGLWAIWPDGRVWEPLLSAFEMPTAFHFQTQMSDGQIVVVDYYNSNNNGFGTLVRFPHSAEPGKPAFGSPDPRHPSNPALAMGRFDNGKTRFDAYPFTPRGLTVVTPFAHAEDNAASKDDDGRWMGKVTQPAAVPHNGLLMVWSPGPVNNKKRPTPKPYYDGGIYLLPGGVTADHPDDLIPIKNDPRYNETQPRPVVSYREIYGLEKPFELAWLPNDGSRHPELPAGTPFGLVGTSSFYRRATSPGQGSPEFDGLDEFNTTSNQSSSNWQWQGADAGRYSNDEIWGVRILAMEPTSHLSYGLHEGQHFWNHANERLRILGEIPLRKQGPDGSPIVDPDGNPDTSFLAKIPADTPFTFQTLDRNGMVLNMAQTWHQLRPGEMRADCGGCHAHDQEPLAFESTAAARPDYRVWDLTRSTPLLSRGAGGEPQLSVAAERLVNVEFYRDIRPLLRRSCVACHSGDNPEAPGRLILDGEDLDKRGRPADYRSLADEGAGYPSVLPSGRYRQSNASRYVRMFQSRRSLLIWKLFGRRLDGWDNEDHPTETVPGDPTTLPGGADPDLADLDFDGQPCPPPDSGVPPLSDAEKLLFARWIDLGAPVDTGREKGHPDQGWFADELRPTLVLSLPRPGLNRGPLDRIRIGAFDAYSGLDPDSLTLAASFRVNGERPGRELAALLEPIDDHVWVLHLEEPLDRLARGTVTASVKDRQGNVVRVERTFSVD